MRKQVDLYTLSKQKVAPVLYAYVGWIIDEAIKRKIETLYFLARDGYILRKIAQRICCERKLSIQCRYLYCSRMSLRMPTYHFIGEEAYQLIFLDGYHVSLQSIFERVVLPENAWLKVIREAGICDDIDLKCELTAEQIQYYKEKLLNSEYFIEHIMDTSKHAYKSTIQYFRQEGLLEQEHLALVDSGWTGSMQRSIRQLLQSVGWKNDLTGFYFGMFNSTRPEDGEYCCYYFEGTAHRENKILFCNNLFECFLSAPHEMTIGYKIDTDGSTSVPVYREKTENNQLQRIQEQIDGIMNGVETLISSKSRVRVKDCQKILRKLMGMPSAKVVNVYGKFFFCDDTTENYYITLAGKEQLGNLKDQLISQKLKNRLMHKKQSLLFWDYGMVALISNPLRRGWYWLNLYLWKECVYLIKMIKR